MALFTITLTLLLTYSHLSEAGPITTKKPQTDCQPKSKALLSQILPITVKREKIQKSISPYNNRTFGEIKYAREWLERFGYLTISTGPRKASQTRAKFRNALVRMQRYANIQVTGILDDATVIKMRSPRCGYRDVEPHSGRKKRYILVKSRWPRHQEIDVQFVNYTRDMTIDEQETVMQWAVDQWADAADMKLVFHQQGDFIPGAEINIYHTRYDDKGKAFSRFGILAYAALPRNGDMFFDDTENWSEYHKAIPQSFSYRTVALHEMGHSLGFAHSDVPSAVMYAFYGPTRHTLTADDRAGAEFMFGPA